VRRGNGGMIRQVMLAAGRSCWQVITWASTGTGLKPDGGSLQATVVIWCFACASQHSRSLLL
jgi:hypothetical protein